MNKICLLVLFTIYHLSASQLKTPAEIIDITSNSKVEYHLSSFDTTAPVQPDTLLVPPDLMLSPDNEIVHQNLTGAVKEEFLQAEKHFQNKSFKFAAEKYLSVYEKAPDFSRALTLAGNSYFALGKYRKAKKLFIKSIKKNFYSYQAHWFLSSTYYQKGDLTNANKEIIIAHLLNRNHAEIRKNLVGLSNTRTIWEDWKFIPQCKITNESDSIKVCFTPDWFGWAITLAAWEFEPGYKDAYDSTNVLDMYKEALLGYLATTQENKDKVAETVRLIVEKNFLGEFLIYEVILPKNPLAMYQISEESFERFFWYLRIFHQHKM